MLALGGDGLSNRVHHVAALVQEHGFVPLPGLRNLPQHSFEARAAVLVLGREVGATCKSTA